MYVDVPAYVHIYSICMCTYRICVSSSALSCRYQTLSASFLTQSVMHMYIHVHVISSACECSKLLLCIHTHYVCTLYQFVCVYCLLLL